MSFVWLATKRLFSFNNLIICLCDNSVWQPIDSNLSIVPPVKPSPLPDNFATDIPNDAIIGAKINVTLSPTPPVECLSMIGYLVFNFVKSIFLLYFHIANVKK